MDLKHCLGSFFLPLKRQQTMVLLCRAMPYYLVISNKVIHSIPKGEGLRNVSYVPIPRPFKPTPCTSNDSGLAVLKTCLARGRKSCWIFFCFFSFVLYVIFLRNVIAPRVSFWAKENGIMKSYTSLMTD